MIGRRHYRHCRGALLAALWFACFVAGAAGDEPRPSLDQRHRELLEQFCIKCHQAEQAEGSFRIDHLPFEIASVEAAERWQKVLNALNSGAMPPAEENQPEGQAKADLLEDLANTIVAARRLLADQKGQKTMRRLNRREFGNTLRELLGVEINVNELPADSALGSFDTLATNQFMSSDQFEQYLALGREALDEAFERQANATTVKKQRFEAEDVVDRVRANLQNRLELRRKYGLWSRAVDQAAERPENHAAAAEIRAALAGQPPWNFYHSWTKLTGAPAPAEYGFVDAETATHEGTSAMNLLPYQAYFLVQPEVKTGAFLTIRDNGVNPIFNFAVGGDWPSGEYVVRMRLAATKQADSKRRFVEFGVHATHLSTHEVLGTMEAPEVIEVRFNLTKNRTGSFFIREKGTFDSNEQAHRVFAAGEKLNGIGPEFAVWVDWTEVERLPGNPDGLPPGIEALGIPLGDDAGAVAPGEIRGAVERFATVACRGETSPPEYFDRLTKIYDRRRQEGVPHGAALKEILAVVLASPRFIYLGEPITTPETAALSANELAVRLAYFLWGSPPDAALRELAARGELTKPDVLAEQVNRLLDDPRSRGFIVPFIHQWLDMDRLEFFRFNNVRYPAFDVATKMAARDEVYETFGYLVQQNASLGQLLSADFVVINSLLAHYYGIADVRGDAFRQVTLPPGSPRGGLLGMAAILAMGSNGERTSPVERGAWVLRKLLNDPPPPAPANVPQISRLDDRLLTTRERLDAHQEQPQCASCHRKIDPFGLGLENFDAVGQWRSEDQYETAELGAKTWTIDPSGSIHRGPEFADFFELRDLIAGKAEAFARGFSIALLQYALGRPYSASYDEELVTMMIDQAREQDFATREFIQVLVASEQFRNR